MKQAKTIKITKMVAKDAEFTFTLITCNTCGKELNDIHSHNIEQKFCCSICGEGHWCRDHIKQVEIESASTYNEWEGYIMQVCEKCYAIHKATIDEIGTLTKQIDEAEEKRYKLREMLSKLGKSE